MAALSVRCAPLLLVMMVAAGCSGGGSSPANSPSPTASAGVQSPTTMPAQTSSPPTPRPNCPVRDDVCALADTFLVAFKRGDVEKIVSSARSQHLTCPDAGDESPGMNSLRIACGSSSPGSDVDVYEVQGGKGPVFVQTVAEYRALSVAAREGTYPDDVTIRAVGCGVKKGSTSGAPDCGTASVVVFQLRYVVGNEPSEVALVFSRPSVTTAWTIEKYWGLAPYASLPATIPPGLRRSMGTIEGVETVELYPYSLE